MWKLKVGTWSLINQFSETNENMVIIQKGKKLRSKIEPWNNESEKKGYILYSRNKKFMFLI